MTGINKAIISADFGWLGGMWEWSRSDRAALLYGVTCAAFLGAIVPWVVKALRA